MLEENANPPAEGQGEAWYSNLNLQPEDIGYIQNKKWAGPEAVVNSYKELEKFRGVSEDKLLIVPKDASDTEAFNKIFTKLGRPEKPEQYGEFKAPEGYEQAIDSERIKWADGIVHKLGLNKAQRDALLNETVKYEGDTFKKYQEAEFSKKEADFSKLKQDWGEAFFEREDLAKRAVRSFLTGSEEEKGQMLSKIEEAVGTAQMYRLFSNIGERLGEDKMPKTDGGRPFGYSREQAMADKQALISELSADKARLGNYNKGLGPDYDRMNNLMKIIAS